MLNEMCKNCLCLGKDCNGTEKQVWTGGIYRKTEKNLEKIIEKECGQYEDDCTKCPYSKECEEYAHR